MSNLIYNGMVVPSGKVFLWRADEKKWTVGKFSEFVHHIGNPNLAYTYWEAIPAGWPHYPPNPENSP